MDRSELVQVLTLWFVVMTFIVTAPGADNPIFSAIEIGSLLLMYLLPLWIVVELTSDFVGGQ
ncbi:hypothetical protein [Halorussus marinus]|uniref:hypothetical protein n=1 Tax=Halorussus marinus TaxID=2505976 RepID=UPI00106E0895|nr:hypothetical protein [Halorussus marinus]